MQFFTLGIHGKIDLSKAEEDQSAAHGIDLSPGAIFPVGIQWTHRATNKGDEIRPFGCVPNGFLTVKFETGHGFGEISNDLLTSPNGGAIIVPWKAFLDDFSLGEEYRTHLNPEENTPYAVLITRASMEVMEVYDTHQGVYRLVPEAPGSEAVFIKMIADDDLWGSDAPEAGMSSEIDTEPELLHPEVLVLGIDCAVLRSGQSFTYSLLIPPERRKDGHEYCRVTVHFDGKRVGWRIGNGEYEYPDEPEDFIA